MGNIPTVFMSHGFGPENVHTACSEIIETQVALRCPICNTELTPLGVADNTSYHDLTCTFCEEHFEVKTFRVQQGEQVSENLTLHGGNYNKYASLRQKPTLIAVGYGLRMLSQGLYAIRLIEVRYYPANNYAVYRAARGSSQISCVGAFSYASADTNSCCEIQVDCRDTNGEMDLEREVGPYGEIVPYVHRVSGVMPSPPVSHSSLFDRPFGPVIMEVC